MQMMLTGRLGGGRKLETVTVDAKNDVDSPITFDDTGGRETAKLELLEALEFISNKENVPGSGIRPLRAYFMAQVRWEPARLCWLQSGGWVY